MGALIALIIAIFLMIIGVPVAFSFAAMTLILAVTYGVDISSLMTTGFWFTNSIVLMALPLFIMTGYLMQSGGVARRLIDFVESLVGRIHGGLGASLVISCAMLGAIAGTATAAVASIGTVMIKPLEERGYPRAYTSALLAISSLLGILIPPSITMILYAVMTRQSVAACFLATIGPGILLVVALCIINNYMVRKHMPQVTLLPPITFKKKVKTIGSATYKAFPALLMPIIILGAIYGGIATPTEAASVVLLYAIPLGFIIYKDLSWRTFIDCLSEAASTTGVIIIIIVFSCITSRIFTYERIPQELTSFLVDTFHNKYIILFMVNIFLVLIGMIMDDLSVTVIIAPMLLPTMIDIGVHPVHFAAIVGTSVVIGANSPPMAPLLYMACHIGEVEMYQVMKPAFIFMFVGAFPVMLITTYLPCISMAIPKLLGFM